MGRPPKKGLTYFPRDTDYYDDLKIMDLMNMYGPLGLVIYDIVITMVYKEGYYLEVSLDKIAAYIMRIVGNRWIKDRNLVLQVIQYCADIGLLHDALLRQSVITSTGIQRRYQEVTVRNKVSKNKYWLLDNDGQVPLNVPENLVSVTETPVFATETPVNVAASTQKKSKPNKIYTTTKGDRSPIEFAEEIFGRPINSTEMEKIIEMQKAYTDDLIILALKETALNNVQHINYTVAILANWKAQGYDTVEKAQEGLKQRRTRTNGKSRSKRPDVLPDYYVQMKSGSEKEITEETDFDREEYEEIRRKLKEQEKK